MNSREKGARGEREWASVLATRFPEYAFRRGIQTRGGGAEAADVYGDDLGVHWEVKRVEALNIWMALAQAETDALHRDQIPVVAFRRNRGLWYAALPALPFLDLLKAAIPYPGIPGHVPK